MIFIIVDDMDNMRRSIRAMLKLIGYGKDYLEAANGVEALEILTKGDIPVDFIISDINMPKMSGIQLLELVRENKTTRDLPFLIITAEANQEVVAEVAEREVDAYLTKPFVTATLEQKIRELLEKQKNPPPYSLHILKARDFEEQGDIGNAIMEMRAAASLNDRSSRAFRELGRLYLKQGDIETSFKCFKRATEINRLDVSAYHYLGQLFYRMGDIDRATLNFARAMEISPRHTDRAIDFGKLLLKQKKLVHAEKVFRLVLRTKGDDLDVKEDIAVAASSHGLNEFAVRLFKELLRADPGREEHLLKSYGMALYETGDTNNSIQILEKAAVQRIEDMDLLVCLAKIYLKLNRPVRADKWATLAVRLDPENKEAKEILDKCF